MDDDAGGDETMRQFIPNRDRGAAGGCDAPRTSPHGMPLEGPGTPGRRSHVQVTDTQLPDPHLQYDITGRRRDRTGLPTPGGRSLSDIRIFLASVFAPLLLVGAAILAFIASRAGGGSRSTFVWLAVACFVLSVGAALDVAQSVWRRRRREQREQLEQREEQVTR